MTTIINISDVSLMVMIRVSSCLQQAHVILMLTPSTNVLPNRIQEEFFAEGLEVTPLQ